MEVISHGNAAMEKHFREVISRESQIRSASGMHNPAKSVSPVDEDARFDIRYMYLRNHVTHGLCWAVPSEDAVMAIARFAPEGVADIGCGYGLWVYMISQAGVPAVGFDLESPTHRDRKYDWPVWAAIRRDLTHVEAARWAARQGKALMLCWPPMDEPMGADTLKAYLKAGGKKVIYIGEGRYGCTGDDRLHRFIDTARHCREFDVPRWSGIHDYGRLLSW